MRALLLVLLLSGCAPAPFSLDAVEGICAFQPIGQDEEGIAYVRVKCKGQP